MRVLFVGASGKVGVELVPLMAMHFETVVLAGRDPKKMAHLFPCFRCVSDQSIAEEARGFDALIHMSAMNNDRDDTPLDDYVAVNVNYLTFIAKQAAQAGVGMFINFSTAHVLRENVSHYSTSKKMGEDALAKVADLKVINLRIPAIYGKVLSGNLARLNKVPAPLRSTAFKLLASARPVISMDTLAAGIIAVVKKQAAAGSIYLADSQDDNPFYRFFKIAFDYMLAIGLLPVFAITYLVLSIIYKALDLGPPIFKQERVGKNGATFTCYKFRSMKVSTSNVPSHEAQTSDITTVGQFLRRSKIDEIPQIYNILRGEMSFVGPRPALPIQHELLDMRKEAGVLGILPGLTGIAQVNGVDMSNPVGLVELDSRYLKLRSILMDIDICIKTAIGGGSGDAAMVIGKRQRKP